MICKRCHSILLSTHRIEIETVGEGCLVIQIDHHECPVCSYTVKETMPLLPGEPVPEHLRAN